MVTQVDGGRGEPRCLAAHLANAMGSVQQVRPRTRVCPGCAIVICRACAGLSLWFALLFVCRGALCTRCARRENNARERARPVPDTVTVFFAAHAARMRTSAFAGLITLFSRAPGKRPVGVARGPQAGAKGIILQKLVYTTSLKQQHSRRSLQMLQS